jgi:hypothetical protein
VFGGVPRSENLQALRGAKTVIAIITGSVLFLFAFVFIIFQLRSDGVFIRLGVRSEIDAYIDELEMEFEEEREEEEE